MDTKKIHEIFLASKGISTDTRTIKEGQIFFALKGDSFDGNKYANQAIENGAAYAVVDNPDVVSSPKYILVDNVLESLQQLAAFHRKHLNIPVLGITGTNGKTTTKELINAVLQKKFKTFATQGNLNNHIGVPLTLLSMNNSTELGIVEMGANHPGEIGLLAHIAQPDFGLITNIGTAHLEGFGSFEGVKKTKNELYRYIAETGGRLFVNADDELLMELSSGIKRILYGKNVDQENFFRTANSGVFLSVYWNEKRINTQLVGAYNFYNILASISTGLYFDVPEKDIIVAIEQYQPKNNRSQFQQTDKNKLIVDVYNANPVSMCNAIENFHQIQADKKLLILGDMFELGKYSEAEHKNILQLVYDLKFPYAYFIGNEFKEISSIFPETNYRFFSDYSELNSYLDENPVVGYTILLKASRGIQLEKVIPFL